MRFKQVGNMIAAISGLNVLILELALLDILRIVQQALWGQRERERESAMLEIESKSTENMAERWMREMDGDWNQDEKTLQKTPGRETLATKRE